MGRARVHSCRLDMLENLRLQPLGLILGKPQRLKAASRTSESARVELVPFPVVLATDQNSSRVPARKYLYPRLNTCFGLIITKTPRPLASTLPFRSIISAMWVSRRPRLLNSRDSTVSGAWSGTGLMYSIRSWEVAAITSRNLLSLLIASSRMVAIMPPWQYPGGPVKRLLRPALSIMI